MVFKFDDLFYDNGYMSTECLEDNNDYYNYRCHNKTNDITMKDEIYNEYYKLYFIPGADVCYKHAKSILAMLNFHVYNYYGVKDKYFKLEVIDNTYEYNYCESCDKEVKEIYSFDITDDKYNTKYCVFKMIPEFKDEDVLYYCKDCKDKIVNKYTKENTQKKVNKIKINYNKN